MRRLAPIPMAFVIGGLAALLCSVLIWLLDLSGIFLLLDIAIRTPDDPIPWMLNRVVQGALWALLFLLPILEREDNSQLRRGALISILPMLYFFLYAYPQENLGYFGIRNGIQFPLTVVVVWVVWGLITGWWLKAAGFRSLRLGS